MASIEHTLWITEKANELLGPAAVRAYEALGSALGVSIPYDPALPIPGEVVVTWVMLAVVLVLGLATARPGRLSVESPRGFFQHLWESFARVIENLLADVVGPGGRRYFPFIASLALYILLGNLLGLLPFLASPTASLNTTLACALTAFIYYHYQGARKLGLRKYARHFMGPSVALAPLMVPIELVSHISRVMSLSLRLFGNIMGEDVVILILFAISPLIAPVPMMAFAIFTSVLQTFIFVMLTMMYLAGAVAEEH